MYVTSTAESKNIPITDAALRAHLAAAKLDWNVKMVQEKHPITGDLIPFYASMREDNLKIFKTGFTSEYHAIQNLDAFRPIAEMSQIGGMTLSRCLSFNDGKRVVVQASLGEMHIGDTLKGGKPDSVTRYLTFVTSHDGTMALQVLITPVRIVCRNTLAMALRGAKKAEATKITIKHTASSKERVSTLAETYRVIEGQFQETESIYNALAKRKITRADFRDVLETMFPEKDEKGNTDKRNQDLKLDIATLYQNADNGQTERDTGWNLYNAITRHNDHHSTVKRGNESDLSLAREKSTLFGTIAEKNHSALVTLRNVLSMEEIIQEAEANHKIGLASEPFKGVDFLMEFAQ